MKSKKEPQRDAPWLFINPVLTMQTSINLKRYILI